MGKYILGRVLRWIPSVLMLLLLIYALVFFGAGDPIKLIFLRAPGDVAYDPERIEENHELYVGEGRRAVSTALRKVARA